MILPVPIVIDPAVGVFSRTKQLLLAEVGVEAKDTVQLVTIGSPVLTMSVVPVVVKLPAAVFVDE